MKTIIFLTAILLTGCTGYAYSPYPRNSGVVICGTTVYTNVNRVEHFVGGTVVVTEEGGKYIEYTRCNTSGL
jgi:hypothetical protein